MDVIAAGAFGGVANEILHWYGLRTNENLPHYARRLVYWIITIAMIAVGSGFAYLQLGPGETNLYFAFELGLLAPLLLKKVVASGPENKGAMSVPNRLQPSVRSFLKGRLFWMLGTFGVGFEIRNL